MGSSNLKYQELSKAKIQENRNIVISKVTNSKDEVSFTMAQQLEVFEGKKSTKVFLKGAVTIDSLENLINLRDAINVALSKLEEA